MRAAHADYDQDHDALLLAAAECRGPGGVTVYDFGSGAGVDRFAFGNAVPVVGIPPATNAIPSTAFGAADDMAVAPSDDSRYGTGVVEGATWPRATMSPATVRPHL